MNSTTLGIVMLSGLALLLAVVGIYTYLRSTRRVDPTLHLTDQRPAGWTENISEQDANARAARVHAWRQRAGHDQH